MIKKYDKRNDFSKNSNITISKNLSYLLRHGAIKEGLTIRQDGYIKLNDILAMPFYKKNSITEDIVNEIVETSDKKRFELKIENINGIDVKYIRAVQGHSIEINDEELLTEITDPSQYKVVIHGTYFQAWEAIKKQGLKVMSRQHMHFCSGYPGDKEVISGMRNSCELYIEIDMEKAIKDGIKFFISTNKVILTRGINGVLPPKYFKFAKQRNGGIIWQPEMIIENSKDVWTVLEKKKVDPIIEKKQKELKISYPKGYKPVISEAIENKPNDMEETKIQDDGKTFDFLMVLDFEAQCIKDKTLDCQEIIEFPVVVIDVKQRKIVSEFHNYIKPVIHPNLYPFCLELTGITQDKVDKGIILEEALVKFDEFLTKNNFLDKSWVFLTCGDWDLLSCLRKECTYKNIQVKDYLRNWINLKAVFPVPPNSKMPRKPGMVEMLDLCKIDLKGRHHSGIDDTRNIASIALHLLENGFEFKRSMIHNIVYNYKNSKHKAV